MLKNFVVYAVYTERAALTRLLCIEKHIHTAIIIMMTMNAVRVSRCSVVKRFVLVSVLIVFAIVFV